MKTYSVRVSYDGVPNWNVPAATHVSEDDAIFFIANTLPPKGCDFDLIDDETGRGRSYLIPPPIVPRRRRLRLCNKTWMAH